MKNYVLDMDGVLVRGRGAIAGAAAFIDRLQASGTQWLILTNNPLYTQRDLAHRLQAIGLNVPAERIFTSAMATARFLKSQKPEGKAFVIGEAGLIEAIHSIGYVMTDVNPDYVVLGETLSYNLEQITRATRLVAAGAHFIATNPDPNGPAEDGLIPACGAMAALIQSASGLAPFFVGKPNPLMMRSALNYLGVHSEDSIMVGDRMDTDVIAGVQSGMQTILVLTGVSTRADVTRFPYQPTWILKSVAEIELGE